MSDDERQALLERMQATLAEAKKMTPAQARERLEDEAKREALEFAESDTAGA